MKNTETELPKLPNLIIRNDDNEEFVTVGYNEYQNKKSITDYPFNVHHIWKFSHFDEDKFTFVYNNDEYHPRSDNYYYLK